MGKLIFSQKNENLKVPKNVKGDPSGFFNIHFVAKYQKIECDPLETKKFEKSYSDEKNQGRELQSCPVLYVTLE